MLIDALDLEHALRKHVSTVQHAWLHWCKRYNIDESCTLTCLFDGERWQLSSYSPAVTTSGAELHATYEAHLRHVLTVRDIMHLPTRVDVVDV